MPHHLRSCVGCARHIRISEGVCPFCGAAVPPARRSPPPRGRPPARLRRAVALATVTAVGGAGGAVLMNLTACTNEDVLTAGDAYGGAPLVEDAGVPPPMEAGADVVSTGSAYGTAVTSDSGPPGDAGPDVVGAAAAYGVARPPDSGPDGGPEMDASETGPDVPDVLTTGDADGAAPPPDSGPDATEAGPAENDASAHDAQPDGGADD